MANIDPVHSLAFTIQSNPGVYALLLGSGVSRSAKIPTGWEITMELTRKLAQVMGQSCDPSPEQWYLQKFGSPPDYSVLLDELARTPAERQQLLRGYLEPTAAEREEGAKQPTPAHRAIAALAASGYIRVIITTNFDRLMEMALVDAGITPTVLSTPDQLTGALPLIHTPCCVIKVHGDYLDTRIRNTPQELAAYPAEFDTLLDRVFDEFGLIVCGWSAAWDEALCRAITRAPSRRFGTYWAGRGDSSDAARRLIEHRGAVRIPIQDADTFFQGLQQQVQSLEEFSRRHPLSIEAAVTNMKRYLSEPRYRIQLDDLISRELEGIREITDGPMFNLQGGPGPDSQNFTARVRAYETACETMVAMAAVGGLWAEETHYPIWQRALVQLATRKSNAGDVLWVELQRYPATLLLYALGLGAVMAGRLPFLGALFATPIHQEYGDDLCAVQCLPPSCLFQDGNASTKTLLEGKERRITPLNDWLCQHLAPCFKRTTPGEKAFERAFDKLEILMALSYAHHTYALESEAWMPHGAYGYRRENRDQILAEMEASLAGEGDRSPYVTSRIFGDTASACMARLATFRPFAQETGRGWR